MDNFKVNERTGSGFSIKFDNGYMVSVQWGPGCYGTNQNASYSSQNLGAMSAEVAILQDSKIIDEPYSYCTPEEVATVIYNVSQRERPNERNRKAIEESEKSS